MATNQYLDLEGLKTLVSQIKAEDKKDRDYADKIVGSLEKGEKTYEDMRSYVDDQFQDMEEGSLTYTNPDYTTVAVGNIKANTNPFAEGLSVTEILTKIFYSYLKPEAYSIAFNPDYTHTNEVGTSMSDISGFKFKVNKKSNPVESVKVVKGTSSSGTVIYEMSDEDLASLNSSRTIEKTLSKSDLNSNFLASDEEFANKENPRFTLVVKDSLVDGNGNQTVTNTTASFSWYYPYFVGTVPASHAQTGFTSDEVIALTKKSWTSKGTQNFNFESDAAYRPVFAYPKSYGELKNIVDTASGADNYNATYEHEVVSVTDEKWGNTEDYYVYCGPAGANAFDYKFLFS